MPRSSALLLCLVALAGVLSACNDDGRALAPAPTVPVSAETTSTAVPPAPQPGFTSGDGLTLVSPSFASGAPLAADFTCDGLDVPPPLQVSGVPGTAAELAVAVTDRSADGYVHWVLTGLPTTVTAIEPGVVPPEATAAVTDGGILGWEGPCPPEGDGPHEYGFVVYALSEPLGLAPGTTGRDAIPLIEQSAIASSVLVGTYARPATG